MNSPINPYKIAIVTPLKNELGNIPLLMESIKKQDMPLEYWIIVENGSNDGSKEFLAGLKEVENVKNFIVINFALPNEKYELGF
ncbi:MAG: glycosyltransferase, partial [Opitutaceae bacterium]|nr:glycosyltransferase [Cytophagales bacterium]